MALGSGIYLTVAGGLMSGLLGAAAHAGGGFDVAGLHPGMTLDEVQSAQLPGADKHHSRRVVCLNERDVATNMVGVMASDADREDSIGVLTCLIGEPDVMNSDYWAPSVVELQDAKVKIWLPFITQASDGPTLAMIMLRPAASGDEAKIKNLLTKALGQPQDTERMFASAVSTDKPEKVSSWQSAQGDVDAVDKGDVYYYDPALAAELDTRLAKLPGRSYFYSVPKTGKP